MSIPSKFEAAKVEKNWYDYWLKHNYFSSTPDERPAYSIVIPPPKRYGDFAYGTYAQQQSSGYFNSSC